MTVPFRRSRRAGTTALVGLTAAALALSACGTAQPGTAARGGKLKVVASTSVWGSVAQAVGGDQVEVEPIISDPSADPHSYESSPRDAAKVTEADLVVYNGGGYDKFLDKILSSTGKGKPTVQAVTSEHEAPESPAEPKHEHEQPEPPAEPKHEHEQPEPPAKPGHEAGHDHSVNEHVWYDLHAVHEVADRIAEELGRLQPDKSQAFRDGAAKFSQDVEGLEGRVKQIAAAHQGRKVIVTEPVAHYLIEGARLEDITPQSFVNAVEAETDPSAAAVADIQNAVTSRQAAAVIYNPQTESPVTEQVRTLAEQNRIPVVQMTETLPAGRTYVQWMDTQISALSDALPPKP